MDGSTDGSGNRIQIDKAERLRQSGRFRLVASAFVALLLLTACGDPGQVLAPPDADVEGIQTILVFSFTNKSTERGLETEVTEGIVNRLGAVGWYDVLAPQRTAGPMSDRRIDAVDMDYASPEWNEAARDIAMDLDADGLILGVVTDYDESVTVGDAYVNQTSEETQWLADQATNVTITVRGKLVNVHTGATVYERTVSGRARLTEARLLNWVIPEAPPDSVIPGPHRRGLTAARDAAIEDALDKLTRDILPQTVSDAEDE